MQNSRLSIRFLITALVVVVIGSWFFRWYFFTGKIVATASNQKNTLVIFDSSNVSGSKKDIRSRHTSVGKIALRLRTGSYTVRELDNKTVLNEKTVNIKAHSSVVVSFNKTVLGTAKALLTANAKSFVAGKDFYKYIDLESGHLVRVGYDGLIQLDYIPLELDRITWVDSDRGYGVGSDGHLYYIQGSVATKINLPSGYVYSMSLDPNNTLYISNGTTLYKLPLGGSVTEWLNPRLTPANVVASKDKVAVFSGSTPEGDGIDGSSDTSITPGMDIYSTNKEVLGSLNDAVSNALWSTDGAKIFVSKGDGSSGIYSSTLRRIGSLEADNSQAVSWIDASNLYYSDNGSVFIYHSSSNQSQVVSNQLRGDVVSMSYVGGVLFITTALDDSGIVYSYNKSAPSSANKFLAGILPLESNTGCLARLVESSVTYVAIEDRPSIGYENCVASIRSLLSTYDESISEYGFVEWPRSKDY